jgi:adenosine deaminase
MALNFARKNRWPYPYESIERVRAAMEFSDLSSFIEVARVNNRTLRTVDDYCDVSRQYLKRMHDENVVHVEVAVSPQGFTTRGLEIKPCIEALASAFREALDNFGITGGIIAGCQRDRPPEEALEMLTELRACGDDILAIGLHTALNGKTSRGCSSGIFSSPAPRGGTPSLTRERRVRPIMSLRQLTYLESKGSITGFARRKIPRS